MFLNKYSSEAYWNSYRLLESQLIRLSHAICFDDIQVGVYSSELADIINSCCIKIESLAKDIYEEHIYPFQIDAGIVPKSFKGPAAKFNPEKWTRKEWKYDYNCLVEIDEKFSLSKKRVKLKAERFQFYKFGSAILPFNNVTLEDCRGGVWEYTERDIWSMHLPQLMDVDWCKSYQDIKHNYIQSIPTHGTVKNAIMVLAAFYLLAIYSSCLPSRHFDWDQKSDKYEMDFGSELFVCEMCNHTLPPFVIDSDQIKTMNNLREAEEKSPQKDIFAVQNRLNDIDGLPFFVVLSQDVYQEVKRQVDAYCSTKDSDVFDIAPYERENGLEAMDAGALLYLNLKKYIRAPYRRNNICIAFNTGLDSVYNDYSTDYFDYEKSKYKKQTEATLSTLQIGDLVDAKFVFDTEVSTGEVKRLDEHSIELCIDVDGNIKTLSEPISNIIYIRCRNKKG